MKDASPLRYPGGKWRVAPFFERVMALNNLTDCHYFEPYAGGGSLALSLLFQNRVSEIHLNDLNPAVHAFWYALLKRNQEFVELTQNTRVTPEEWNRQKLIHMKGSSAGKLALAFATFFLNRRNYSGILNGGMIGGKAQIGAWRLDARFNKPELIRRIRRVALFKTRIHLSCRDAIEFLTDCNAVRDGLVYLDPPYYRSGRDLYYNAYRPCDHAAVRDRVRKLRLPWIVSYDDVPEIRDLYSGFRSRRLQLQHTARNTRIGREVLFFGPGLRIPAIR